MIIYLDESGDLGFDLGKAGSSRYFTITMLAVANKETAGYIKTAVKRTLKNKINHKKANKRLENELKGSKTTLEVKQYFMQQMPLDHWKLYSAIVNKQNVYSYLATTQGKNKLYNYISGQLIKKIEFPSIIHSDVELIVDRCKNTQGIKDFNQYLGSQLESVLPLSTNLKIQHNSSYENAGLQAVDLFCWGISRKYSHNDQDWYSLYSKWIREEVKIIK
jgi:phage host-nuclease inhibitor protein Gam